MTQITVIAGKTHTIKLVYKDGNGIVIDITGGTAQMAVRKDMYTPILFTTTATITGATGTMEFVVNPVDTINLVPDKCVNTFICGFELTKAGGEVVPFLEGTDFIIQQAVVR